MMRTSSLPRSCIALTLLRPACGDEAADAARRTFELTALAGNEHRTWLGRSQDEVNRPTLWVVGSGAPEVVEQVRLVAPRILPCVSQDRQPDVRPVGVDASGEPDDRLGPPAWLDGIRTGRTAGHSP